ncbi:MAG TPA: TM0106 family RecB-like putative nuclease, partial [Polyangiaceae bacterium]
AYYRSAKRRFEGFVGMEREPPYPEPVPHCEVCPWWKRCEDRRRADDHLSLVAGITRRQRDRLSRAGVTRVSELGALDGRAAVEGISAQALHRIREQARIQIAGRSHREPIFELLPDPEPGMGLESLPLPKPGDLFLDIEGDPFVQGDGLDYLFGILELGEPSTDDWVPRSEPGPARYHGYWAVDVEQEKRAFEAVVDRVTRGRDEFRNLHVFHYGNRENEAFKRLSCKHRTREEAVDQFLREHVLVDLYDVLRRALRASVESYGLKHIERLYRFQRSVDLRVAARAMQLFGWWLETGEGGETELVLRKQIEGYNRDDCLSTWKLRDWLETLREELEVKAGRELGRPEPKVASADSQEKSKNARALSAAVAERLIESAGDEASSEADAKRLLAALLDWHWREAKSSYWEYYRARELPPSERISDRTPLGELVYLGELRAEKRSKVHRYEFPQQEHAIRKKPGAEDADTGNNPGRIVEIGAAHLDLKRGIGSTVPHPRALVPAPPIETDDQAARLLAFGEAIAERGLSSPYRYRAGIDLLLRSPPRCGQRPGGPLLGNGESVRAAIQRLALSLDHSVLAIQGPPGSGKTHRAAEMIVELIRAGRKIGVTANSHKVIVTLLKKTIASAADSGVSIRPLHMASSEDLDDEKELPFGLENKYEKVRRQIETGQLNLVGGTAWAWSKAVLEDSIDVLVVDEAGQLSLANVLAISPAAQSLILFGDPAQLEQPQKGVHPPGADVSALEHLLGNALTMPPDRGVFLPETRRLHPAICDFTSRVFYEGRLKPVEGLDLQSVDGPWPCQGSGLRFVAVHHQGNSNQSDEEVGRIAEFVDQLFSAGAHYTDQHGKKSKLRERDVLIVAPYNAQVAALRRRIPGGIAVGTVDRFQGQEAPIVIYSLTTSTADDAPRGLDFLYSLNRLNVATSRARALVILVGNPALARVSCRTPIQMRLVNALCTYLEMEDSEPRPQD